LSGNLKAGNITFIPEFRFDSSNQQVFLNQEALPVEAATQVLLAVVFAF